MRRVVVSSYLIVVLLLATGLGGGDVFHGSGDRAVGTHSGDGG